MIGTRMKMLQGRRTEVYDATFCYENSIWKFEQSLFKLKFLTIFSSLHLLFQLVKNWKGCSVYKVLRK